MVRGTNKVIIEINDTGSPYFERAVLYLKDSPATLPRRSLEGETARFLGSLRSTGAGLGGKGRFWRRWTPRFSLRGGLEMLLAAGLGAGAVWLLLL